MQYTMRNKLRKQLLYIDKILLIIVFVKTIESGSSSAAMNNSLAWTRTKQQLLNRTDNLENKLDRRKSKDTKHGIELVNDKNDRPARDVISHEIAIPTANYINEHNKTAGNSLSKFVNSSQLFENIMLHVNIKNSTYSNVYSNRPDHANQSRISNHSVGNIEKPRRDTSKIRIHPLKSKTVIRSSDHKRPRPKKEIDKIRQVQSELNNEYYAVKDEGGEDIEYDANIDMQNVEDDKIFNHKLDRSLFDRTNHNYNPDNPIHSINQLYTSFQSQDMNDYSTYNPIGHRNIGLNPMTPYLESSSLMPTFTTPRYYEMSNVRRFPPGYYHPNMRPATTTTTAAPDYDYFEEEVQDVPIVEAKKRWSQPLNPYNIFSPLSKLSSGYGGYGGYGHSAPEYSQTGYGSSGPSYHGPPPDYGQGGHGHSGHGHGHHHIPVITETIIHKPPPKFDFKKLLMITLFKFGLSKLKWFLLLKLLLLKLIKLKFILFLVFLKIYLFLKFLKFLKLLKFLLLPLLLLPLLPLLLLAGFLLFLPVPVLAPSTTSTSSLFSAGTLPIQGRRRRRRRDLPEAAFKMLHQGNIFNLLHPDDATLLMYRIIGAEEFLQRIVCGDLKRADETSHVSINVYRWLHNLSVRLGFHKSRFCEPLPTG